MPAADPPRLPGRNSLLVGVVWGTLFGLVLRLLAEANGETTGFWVMTLAFLIIGPVAIGYITVRPHPNPTRAQQFCAPWVPIILGSLIAGLLGLEGSICIIMGAPIMLLAASIGGVWAARRGLRVPLPAMIGLPFLVAAIESRIDSPERLQRVESEIRIEAPAWAVWQEIASVREISPAELPAALYLRMGFPPPLSAEIDRPGIGAIRQARFAGGVLFLETVTEWEPGARLGFRIAAQTDSIPPSTLDPHVIIGGAYFDVLRGRYLIDSIGPRTSVLHLASELRVSTHFNWYAGWWADAVMGSIQSTILQVQKARAERKQHARSGASPST